MMRLGHVELFVRDPLASKEFYEQILGFQTTAVQEPNLVWMQRDHQEFLLRPGVAREPVAAYQAASAGFVLYTDNLSRAADELRRRGLKFRGDDGEKCLTFTDPDGHWFQLVNPDDH